ncbi:DUF2301 domain-containing membrane protein [Psychromonas sp. SA13A]|uniref:DUF2301 domain-containing membrane protein n=1 Tax=Psychromonas sp. SA13A TaxID=2686346 RepID=UPI00140C09F1|nr:DUF2301 domain-containing membrane protein [Psychromonas sp. SA13A]
MADIKVKEKLTLIDKVSIISYRAGMIFFTISLLIIALQQLYYPVWYKHGLVWIAFSVFLMAANLHIYDKNIRYILVTSAWLGVWLVSLSFISSGQVATHLSLGALLICCAGVSYKESFCFSLMIVKINPLLLCVFYYGVVFSKPIIAATFAIVSALISAYMAYKKLRMPLHYDLGDRSKYQH